MHKATGVAIIGEPQTEKLLRFKSLFTEVKKRREEKMNKEYSGDQLTHTEAHLPFFQLQQHESISLLAYGADTLCTSFEFGGLF